jgi:hypothetical protein
MLLFIYYYVRHYQNDKRGHEENPKNAKVNRVCAIFVGTDCATSELIIIPDFPPQ